MFEHVLGPRLIVGEAGGGPRTGRWATSLTWGEGVLRMQIPYVYDMCGHMLADEGES